jgi:nucleotide-binding universal stress UspA family protein
MGVQVRHLVCTTDFSEASRHTIPYGITLAKELGAKVTICHILNVPPVITHGEVIADPDWDREEAVKTCQLDLERMMEGQPVPWEPYIAVGHVADEINRFVKENKADLVITATHGRSGLKRLILGSVTERLMRILHCPVLVVRSTAERPSSPSTEGDAPFRILVGCDRSSDSLLAFQWGLNLAQQFQSEIHLVHVLEPSVYRDLMKPASTAGDQNAKDLQERIREELSGMVPEEALNWCSVRISLLAGQPYDELLKYAVVNDMDLIVLGFRGQGLMETLLMGSTTARVVRQAPCPVLSVRPLG